jgi:diguanylate cyclase (GGDEF)-like protein
MLDLDNFKDVNDTLGHDVGDILLKAAAMRLSAALRKVDTVARFGGDEFVLILPDLKVIEDAIPVAQKIVDRFHKPFLIDTHQLVVTTSIGIAVYPNDGLDEGILLKNADIAMYQAKQAGRARYQLCKRPEDALLIAEDLPNIEADELKVKEIIYNLLSNQKAG